MDFMKAVKKVLHPGALSEEELNKIKNTEIKAHEASVQNAVKSQEEKHIAPHQPTDEELIAQEEKRRKRFAR